MASFIEDLWTSVFTAGPTPTLLIATNVTFGALELVLLALLIMTYSIHFLILFVLAGSLWWGINWFVAELRLAQAEEEKTLKGHIDPNTDVPGIDPDGDDTEVEADDDETSSGARRSTPQASSAGRQSAAAGQSSSTGSGARLTAGSLKDSVRQRAQRRSMAESTGSLSTDSEWEKVEDER